MKINNKSRNLGLISNHKYTKLLTIVPSNAYIWIHYMAFTLLTYGITDARLVAEKALSNLSETSYEDEFKLWIAYLNLESFHCEETPNDCFLEILHRAFSRNDTKRLYSSAAEISRRAGMFQLCRSLALSGSKKYSRSSKMWQLYIQNCTPHRNIYQVLDRALYALEPRKHIKILKVLLTKEFDSGEFERGSALFEEILPNTPHRLDLWLLYLDHEIRHGDHTKIRALFERAITLKFSAKKMKHLFKKYMDYEKTHGTHETIEYVKKKALDFIAGNYF
eukprot:gnl/TRDRNA2_/TRDRNA2_172772_c0_seq1.p1 gnl/TRDRNA2_/TRDRNA2_172772_c0~~gnl/TRDRNA2_/TRDRNA2_172772_c0_seq1.p1  ORF type:complete len:278 (-),score=-15.58 gnl/TRDRNA2_/TRDRNA2_172772_c0_seq1:97-930(-)